MGQQVLSIGLYYNDFKIIFIILQFYNLLTIFQVPTYKL